MEHLVQFDQAKKNIGEDLLERDDFVKQIARAIVLPENAPSLTVGIEGSWGSGKTTIINFVKERLEEYGDDLIIIDFNPWLISSLDSLVEGFFVQLAAGIGKKSGIEGTAAVATKILQFGKFLSPIKFIPGVEPWGTLVETVLASVGGATEAALKFRDLDLVDRKEDLRKSLQKLIKPIVVVIDDIDRLPPEQVRTIFQLIKAIGDFPRISYLVAFDTEQVAKALSYEAVYDGKQYCDKIVQCSYHVPRFSYFHKRNLLLEALKTFTSLTDNEQSLLNCALNDTEVIRTFKVPREIIRVVFRLNISARALEGEVCFPDLLLFETLAQKYPEVITYLIDNMGRFVSAHNSGDEIEITDDIIDYAILKNADSSKGTKEIQGWLDNLLKEYTPVERSRIKSLMCFLFPKIAPNNRSVQPDCANRLHETRCLLMTLQCGTTSFVFSAAEAVMFLSNPEIRVQVIGDLLESGEITSWLLNMLTIIPHHSVNDPENICLVLCKIANSQGNIQIIDPIVDNIVSFLQMMIKALPVREAKIHCLRVLVNQSDSLAIAEKVLIFHASALGMWKNGIYSPAQDEERASGEVSFLTPEEVVLFKNMWISNVRSVANNIGIFESQRNPISILYRWAQLNDNNYDEVSEYIIKCASNSEWLERFLKFFNSDFSDNLTNLIGNKANYFGELIAEKLPDDKHAMSLASILCKSQIAHTEI